MTNPNCFYVYVVFRPWNGEPCYVGKGKGNRWLDHEKMGNKHYNRHLARIFQKARRLELEIPIVKLYNNLTEKDAFTIERALVLALGRGNQGPLTNMTNGGEGNAGLKFSKRTRTQMSEQRKGNQHAKGSVRTSEERENTRIRMKGNNFAAGSKWTEKRRLFRREQAKIAMQEPTRRQKNLAQLAATREDPISQAKASAALKAKWQDPAYQTKTLARQREGANAFWNDPEKRQVALEIRKAHMQALWADPVWRAKELARRQTARFKSTMKALATKRTRIKGRFS